MKHTIKNKKQIWNKFIQLNEYEVDIQYQDGYSHTINRFLIEGKNGASVLIFDPVNDLALMVKQFRVGMIHEESGESLECPAGLIDDGEHAIDAVIREVEEETGLSISPDMLSQVSDASYVSCGLHSMRISVFVCQCDLSNVETGIYGTDSDEYIETVLVPYSELINKMKNKEIKHITQISALQHSVLLTHGLI